MFHIWVPIPYSPNLNEFLWYLTQFEYESHCIILTETWQIFSTFTTTVNSTMNHLNQNDWVLIYIRFNIKYQHEIILLTDNIIHPSLEFNSIIVNIISFYRSPETFPLQFTVAIDQFSNLSVRYRTTSFLCRHTRMV